MSTATIDRTGITVVPVAANVGLWQWSATLGDGVKRGFADTEAAGLEAAGKAKRYLAAIESHDPDAIEAQAAAQFGESGQVEMVSAWGGRILVNQADVETALANGCALVGDDEPLQHAGTEAPAERARTARRRKDATA